MAETPVTPQSIEAATRALEKQHAETSKRDKSYPDMLVNCGKLDDAIIKLGTQLQDGLNTPGISEKLIDESMNKLFSMPLPAKCEGHKKPKLMT